MSFSSFYVHICNEILVSCLSACYHYLLMKIVNDASLGKLNPRKLCSVFSAKLSY
jgi:hypothetical protein